jgi:hypothetical protein
MFRMAGPEISGHAHRRIRQARALCDALDAKGGLPRRTRKLIARARREIDAKKVSVTTVPELESALAARPAETTPTDIRPPQLDKTGFVAGIGFTLLTWAIPPSAVAFLVLSPQWRPAVVALLLASAGYALLVTRNRFPCLKRRLP